MVLAKCLAALKSTEALSRSPVRVKASLVRAQVRHAQDGDFYEDEEDIKRRQIHRLLMATGRGTIGGRVHCKGCDDRH